MFIEPLDYHFVHNEWPNHVVLGVSIQEEDWAKATKGFGS